MSLFVDTCVLLAALDTNDPDHRSCETLLSERARTETLMVADTVLVELAYWVPERLGARVWHEFVADLLAGAYTYVPVTPGDIQRASEIDQGYADLELGFVDASLIALCERFAEKRLATINYRDFRAVVPRHCQFLTLLPADE